MSFSVYDPRGASAAVASALASRTSRLAGATIGFLDNGKEQADVMLARIGELLERRHGITRLETRKPSHSRVALPENIAALAPSDMAVTALGG